MTILVALLSAGKGTWTSVIKVIKSQEWSKVILIGNEFAKQNFVLNIPHDFINLDLSKPIPVLKSDMMSVLKPYLNDTEVALNLESGYGSEHIALIGAVMSLGLGFRLVFVNGSDYVCW